MTPEEIQKKISVTNYMFMDEVSPKKLATYLASLEERIEALEEKADNPFLQGIFEATKDYNKT